MKLTEKQLAEIFKYNKKNNTATCSTDDIFTTIDASDQRLAAVENISDSNQLSASFQVINQLNSWSKNISHDLDKCMHAKLSLKSMFTENLLSWLKPSLATAAIATSVYFIAPQMTQELNNHHQSDRIFLTTSFEDQNNDVIKSNSFDNRQTKQDFISKTNFG